MNSWLSSIEPIVVYEIFSPGYRHIARAHPESALGSPSFRATVNLNDQRNGHCYLRVLSR